MSSKDALSRLKVDPQSDRRRPSLPPALMRPGWVHIVLVTRVCVSEAGKVTNIAVLRKGDPLVDRPAVYKLSTWRYAHLS